MVATKSGDLQPWLDGADHAKAFRVVLKRLYSVRNRIQRGIVGAVASVKQLYFAALGCPNDSPLEEWVRRTGSHDSFRGAAEAWVERVPCA